MVAPEIASTPEPPYYAVIFVSTQTDNLDGYHAAMDRMEELVAQRPGYLGMDSARSGLGVTVSYWSDEAAITAWRDHLEHSQVRELGRERWYGSYSVQVARVERSYRWSRS